MSGADDDPRSRTGGYRISARGSGEAARNVAAVTSFSAKPGNHVGAPDISSCRVVLDVPHRHQHQRSFHVRVSVAVPDAEPIVVERELPSPERIKDHEACQDAYALVRDAFDVTRRRLQNEGARRRCKT